MTAVVFTQQRTIPVTSHMDSGQVLHTFFCRALYDYQSNDLSSLSFRKGNVIEVLTQLESGWWDGLLNDERGWFPSNYVVQISDQEAAVDLIKSGMLSSKGLNPEEDSEWLSDAMEYRPQEDPSPMMYSLSSSTTESWVPEVTSDGQIYYINSITGETSREIPSETDYERNATVFPSSDAQNSRRNRSRSNSNAEAVVLPSREPAGFGVHRRSNTPEPWIKRLADDGMSYYFVHSVTQETRWTPPSPQPNELSRLRANSDTTYDSRRLSVYSDSSEIHPFIAGATLKPRAIDIPPSVDTNAAEIAARQLQDALLPAPVESFAALVDATRLSIRKIIESVTNSDTLAEHVEQTVLALRRLLNRSGTLVAGIKLSTALENEEAINARLKPLQRKVTATLSKVVLSARAAQLHASSAILSLGRVKQDAADLDRAVIKFVTEVQQCNFAHLSSKRLTGVLLSGDGAAGIGVGLVGAGVGGGWKGLGYVPVEESGPQRRLSTGLITEFLDQKAILDEKAQVLISTFPSSEALSAPDVRSSSRDFLSRLFIFTNVLSDTNVAQHVDVDGFRRPSSTGVPLEEDAYVLSIDRARVIVRKLEATIQALYDGGAIFFLGVQGAVGSMTAAISSLLDHIANAVELIESLYTIGHDQAALSAGNAGDYDYSRSISWRMSRLNAFDDSFFSDIPPSQELEYGFGSDAQISMGPNGDVDDVVDMELAFNTLSRSNPHTTAITGHRHTAQVSNSLFSEPTELDLLTQSTRSTSDSLRSTSDASLLSYDDSSVATVTISNDDHEKETIGSTIEANDLSFDDDIGFDKPKPRANSKSNKIEQFFGGDAPTRYLIDAKADSKPWYLKSDYPPSDIMLNPDRSVRAATLPALIEHLTDHEYRGEIAALQRFLYNSHTEDTNYIRTFLLTFKSFSSIEEVFDLLVARFSTAAPEGLTETQYQEWKKEKQDVFQIRVLNIMKQLIMEDDVLDQEDTRVLSRVRDFAISVQDISAPAKLLVRVAERALNGEDAIIKTLTQSVHNIPPPSILPKLGKKLKLLDIDPLEMARQLTIMESTLYNRIRVMECLNRAKEQKSKNANLDNISAIIERTNQVTTWINQQVLDREDSRKRAAVIKYFITVAERCRMMHNYSTMGAMVSGLNTPPIRRLKRTWDQVGGRVVAMLESCEKIFDSNRNFSNYRNTLARIEPPCVPFLGTYLTTLVFINEGSKDILPPPQTNPSTTGQHHPTPPSGPLINFAKRQKAAEVIREIKNWQTKPYNLHTVSVIQGFIEESLSQFGKVDDMGDTFWNRSLELEPKEREDEKMARLLQESGFL